MVMNDWHCYQLRHSQHRMMVETERCLVWLACREYEVKIPDSWVPDELYSFWQPGLVCEKGMLSLAVRQVLP